MSNASSKEVSVPEGGPDKNTGTSENFARASLKRHLEAAGATVNPKGLNINGKVFSPAYFLRSLEKEKSKMKKAKKLPNSQQFVSAFNKTLLSVQTRSRSEASAKEAPPPESPDSSGSKRKKVQAINNKDNPPEKSHATSNAVAPQEKDGVAEKDKESRAEISSGSRNGSSVVEEPVSHASKTVQEQAKDAETEPMQNQSSDVNEHVCNCKSGRYCKTLQREAGNVASTLSRTSVGGETANQTETVGTHCQESEQASVASTNGHTTSETTTETGTKLTVSTEDTLQQPSCVVSDRTPPEAAPTDILTTEQQNEGEEEEEEEDEEQRIFIRRDIFEPRTPATPNHIVEHIAGFCDTPEEFEPTQTVSNGLPVIASIQSSLNSLESVVTSHTSLVVSSNSLLAQAISRAPTESIYAVSSAGSEILSSGATLTPSVAISMPVVTTPTPPPSMTVLTHPVTTPIPVVATSSTATTPTSAPLVTASTPIMSTSAPPVTAPTPHLTAHANRLERSLCPSAQPPPQNHSAEGVTVPLAQQSSVVPSASSNTPATAKSGVNQDNLNKDLDLAVNEMVQQMERQLENIKKLARSSATSQDAVSAKLEFFTTVKEQSLVGYECVDAFETGLSMKYSCLINQEKPKRLPKVEPKIEELAQYFEVLLETTILSKRPNLNMKLRGVLVVQINRMLRILNYFMCENKTAPQSNGLFDNVNLLLMSKKNLVILCGGEINLGDILLRLWYSTRYQTKGPCYKHGALLDHHSLGPKWFMERIQKFKVSYERNVLNQAKTQATTASQQGPPSSTAEVAQSQQPTVHQQSSQNPVSTAGFPQGSMQNSQSTSGHPSVSVVAPQKQGLFAGGTYRCVNAAQLRQPATQTYCNPGTGNAAVMSCTGSPPTSVHSRSQLECCPAGTTLLLIQNGLMTPQQRLQYQQQQLGSRAYQQNSSQQQRASITRLSQNPGNPRPQPTAQSLQQMLSTPAGNQPTGRVARTAINPTELQATYSARVSNVGQNVHQIQQQVGNQRMPVNQGTIQQQQQNRFGVLSASVQGTQAPSSMKEVSGTNLNSVLPGGLVQPTVNLNPFQTPFHIHQPSTQSVNRRGNPSASAAQGPSVIVTADAISSVPSTSHSSSPSYVISIPSPTAPNVVQAQGNTVYYSDGHGNLVAATPPISNTANDRSNYRQ